MLTTEKIGSYIRWNPGGVLGIALMLTMLSIWIGDALLNGARGEQYHQQLIQEFRAIQPLPGAAVVGMTDSYSPWHSAHQALVSASYTTAAQWPEIREYYDQELKSKGWQFSDDQPYRVWGEDLGGRLRDYCKGELNAELEYAGSQAGRSYSLGLSWGLGHKFR